MFAWSSCCRKKYKLTSRVEETRVARSEEVTERAEERRKQQARLRFSPEKPHGDRRQPCPGLGTCNRLLALCPFPPLSASLVAQMVQRLPAMQETRVQSLGQEDPLEKEMAIHSSTLAWKTPWMEEPGGLQSMGLQRVGHN